MEAAEEEEKQRIFAYRKFCLNFLFYALPDSQSAMVHYRH
jgi:hypothetical protein